MRGEADAAAEALGRAAALLPAEGIESHWHVYPDHVAIWHALGQAELAAGRSQEALGWLRQAVTSGAEHLESPIPYVRSLYLLGRIHRQRGEEEEAQRQFQRFLALWLEGDLDRAQIAEALTYAAKSSDPGAQSPPVWSSGEGFSPTSHR